MDRLQIAGALLDVWSSTACRVLHRGRVRGGLAGARGQALALPAREGLDRIQRRRVAALDRGHAAS